MVENIRPYNEDEFKKIFVTTDLYQQLVKDFDTVTFKKNFDAFKTPRQVYGEGYRTLFTACIFYYLEFLTKHNPKEIYDLGCGWNIFKKYIPGVIGVAGELPTASNYFGDIHDYIDNDFMEKHRNYYNSVVCIGTLNFLPFKDFRKIVAGFVSMVKTGGHGLLTLNIGPMIQESNKGFEGYTPADYEKYIRTELVDIDCEWEVVDVDLTVMSEMMNGNVRLVCHKIT
jgi:hypothetical protein